VPLRMRVSAPNLSSGAPARTARCGRLLTRTGKPTAKCRHQFETRFLPGSLPATRRGFTFYALSFIHEFTRNGSAACFKLLKFVTIRLPRRSEAKADAIRVTGILFGTPAQIRKQTPELSPLLPLEVCMKTYSWLNQNRFLSHLRTIFCALAIIGVPFVLPSSGADTAGRAMGTPEPATGVFSLASLTLVLLAKWVKT
jgi:hypothetical protein